VLDINVLNKDFYKKLVEWYAKCFADIQIDLSAASRILNKKIEEELKPQAVIRIIVRMMFIWFMKEKGLIFDKFFKRDFVEQFLTKEDAYYNAILQNLFFAVLNKKIDERRFRKNNPNNKYNAEENEHGVFDVFRYRSFFKEGKADEFLELTKIIPFVNGGLFQCHDYKFTGKDEVTNEYNKDKNYLIDGFSESKRAKISNSVIFELIDLFGSYVWTIEESTPTEQDIALDPELLGTVFENLIGFYNPETKENARKQTGSFYTPREIVDYMCRESLKEALKTKFPNLHAQINDLIDKNEDQLNFPDKNNMLAAITNLKILDPACGSGAFPMGMFMLMVHTIEKLQQHKTTYKNKVDIITHCIYGIDIQNIAIEISKLRFFISLLVDYQTPDKIADFEMLPNLETKFVVANTLIGIEKNTEYDIFGVNRAFEELTQIFLPFTDAKTSKEKEKIKNEFETKKQEIVSNPNFEFGKDAKNKILAWNPFNVCYCSPFFDSGIMFGVNDGFDVVIGNPPYVSTKGVNKEEKLLLEREYGFADDTYSHFFFKGIKILSDHGNLTYITPKTFWTTQTKKNLRNLLLAKQFLYIFDTANPFESAMVDTCITSVSNKKGGNNPLKFLDGSNDLSNPIQYFVKQDIYLNTQNSVIFKPTPENMKIYELYGQTVKDLYNKWWDKISTSKNIEKNKKELENYRNNLKPGDIALLGCLTEGGQGLATANNGKYIAVRKSTKWAKNILNSRPQKLAEVIKTHKIQTAAMANFGNTADYLASLSEQQIATLFDELKERHGRDIFGQGYLYRLINDDEIADVDTLTDDEKKNGIAGTKPCYVPYDKGDKDGNRWYLETPFAIAWTQKNVGFLKANSGKKGEGMPVVRNPQFYFKEGFCWSNVLTTHIKCRKKQKTVHSTESMSFFSVMKCVPEFYMICMINSRFVAYYVDSFVNSTSHCTTGDAKLIPIIIPTDAQLEYFKALFNKALKIREYEYYDKISEQEAETILEEIQKDLDAVVNELYEI
jgi:hypothetical protein